MNQMLKTFEWQKKAFNMWIFLCLISPAAFCDLALWIHDVSEKACDYLMDKLLERVGGAPSLIALPSVMVIGIGKLEMHLFANIMLSHYKWVIWLDGSDSI